MDEYIFFSKSNWREAPRLRHQVADLIRRFGGKVYFYQKPLFVWQRRAYEERGRVDDNLSLARTFQLIHHQLRVLPVLGWMNSVIEKKSIRTSLGKNISKSAVIVNFNYDYFFLRDIFPENRIVTIINDDFVAQAKFFSGKHARAGLKKTCARSDLVLAVSYPLIRQVSEWCSPELFFPWADTAYKTPTVGGERNAVLLWAHIDARVDFDLLRRAVLMRPSVIFYIVGPQAPNVKDQVDEIAAAVNVVVVSSAKLDDLPVDRFFAAIIPYKRGVADIEAVTMSNKSLQLMSRGLPIVAHGMPEFYEHPAIFKSAGIDGFLAGLDHFIKNFSEIQGSIKNLVSNNQPENRFEFLRNLISKIGTRV